MAVLVDGALKFSTNLPNLDGATTVSGEYNLNIPVSVPAGKHLVEITNMGSDWFYLDWVQLNQVLPSSYAGNWQPSPAAIGLKGQHESLLYVVAPWVSFPASATNAVLPAQQNQVVALLQWPAGTFIAEWHDPATAAVLGSTQSATTNGLLTLPLPSFTEDLAGIIYAPPLLSVTGMSVTNGFQFRLESRTGARCLIQRSTDLLIWTPFLSVTNATGSMLLSEPGADTNAESFLRASQAW